MNAPFTDVVASLDELRAIYREPAEFIRAKKVPRLDDAGSALHRGVAVLPARDGRRRRPAATSRPAADRPDSSARSTSTGW